MTYAELEKVVSKVSFCGLFSGVKLQLQLSPIGHAARLSVTMPVSERSDGFPTAVHAVHDWDFFAMERWTTRDALKQVFRAYGELVHHELDESFIYDGIRPWDPHEKEDRIKRGEAVSLPMLPDNHGQPMNPSGEAVDDASAPYGLAQTSTPSSAGPPSWVPAERISTSTPAPKPPVPTGSDGDRGV